MKFLPLLLLFSLSAFAQKGDNFDRNKQRALQTMQQRKEINDQAIACVESATNNQEVHVCRQRMRSQLNGIRGQKGNRKDSK